MLKLNVVLAALIAAPLFAHADDMKSVTLSADMTFTFDIKKDKELSKPGVTVYDMKTGRKDKYSPRFPEYATKWIGSSSAVIEIEGLEKVEIKSGGKDQGGFDGQGVSITLNADGTASAVGIIDHGEQHSNMKYSVTDKGFQIKGEGFQPTMDLMLNSERGERDSLLGTMFPPANDGDLVKGSRTMVSKTGLVCEKIPKKQTLRCSITIDMNETGKVRMTPEAIAQFQKGVEEMKAKAKNGR